MGCGCGCGFGCGFERERERERERECVCVFVCVCVCVCVGWGVGVGAGWVLGVGVTVGVGVGVAVAVAVLLRRGRFEWCSWGNAKLDQFKLVVFFGASALLHSLYYEQIAFSFSALRGISIIYPLLAAKACSALWRFLLTRCLLESFHCDMGVCEKMPPCGASLLVRCLLA